MLSHELNQDEQINNWQFLEVWIDPILFPPRVLLLVSDQEGCCGIYDPGNQYKLIFKSDSYEQANSWLLEDEYERLETRVLAEEVL